jgi:phosphomannomutase
MAVDLSLIFKAYDVRGVYPEQFDEDASRRIGRAFARWVGADRIVLGRDCRLSSPALSEAFVEGVVAEGTGVVDLGLATTDLVYFASGRFDLPGAMFTASHNPAQYNGLKLCRPGAAPVGEETGLFAVRDLAAGLNGAGGATAAVGAVEHRDILDEYIEHLLSFADLGAFRPLTVAADAANGMAGLVVPRLFEHLPATLVPLYMDLDGTFPNHPADPIQPENQRDLRAAVVRSEADLGLAFDGDADRVFLVDEHARDVSGSLVTALVAKGMLQRFPGSKIVHNLICSWAVPEVIRENGGVPVRTRVGHSFIKQVMAETGAVFGGEHSGHYYFREHYRADSGLVASMVVMDQLSKAGVPLSDLLAPFDRYRDSGEINSEVADQAAKIEEIAAAFADGRQDRLDGLTVEFDDWWFNVRASNTEPLLRLNVEARTPELLEEKTAEVLSIIRDGKGD